ncbi:hypothetical protein G3N93_22085 [Burkholderia sp. Se-20378]|nr:hypothetical protein [Burkholderia sp. Se-20378]
MTIATGVGHSAPVSGAHAATGVCLVGLRTCSDAAIEGEDFLKLARTSGSTTSDATGVPDAFIEWVRIKPKAGPRCFTHRMGAHRGALVNPANFIFDHCSVCRKFSEARLDQSSACDFYCLNLQ